MKALIFRETGEPNSVLELAEIPTPPLAQGEALVRVLLTPIHPSDLHMVRGRYGRVAHPSLHAANQMWVPHPFQPLERVGIRILTEHTALTTTPHSHFCKSNKAHAK
jgi:hypothetical protein